MFPSAARRACRNCWAGINALFVRPDHRAAGSRRQHRGGRGRGPKRGLALPSDHHGRGRPSRHRGRELVQSVVSPRSQRRSFSACKRSRGRRIRLPESLAKQGAGAGEPGPDSSPSDQDGRRQVEGDHSGGWDQSGVGVTRFGRLRPTIDSFRAARSEELRRVLNDVTRFCATQRSCRIP
jgi:hypothetical protein